MDTNTGVDYQTFLKGKTEAAESDWPGLYSEGWKGLITPAAFAHPAKFSRALIRHIYEHAIAEGWLSPGGRVVDPFGGVGLGGIDAALNGLHYTGVELEPKFVDLGNQNIQLWEKRYRGKLARWGSARLLQADSRNLISVIGAADAAISSPPYAGAMNSPQKCGIDWEKAGRPDRVNPSPDRISPQVDGGMAYGATSGQLGSMPAGDYDACLSSPPYSEARIGQESGQEHCGRNDAYGGSDGQLGNMQPGEYDAAISSLPYADGCARTGGDDPNPEHIQGGAYHGVGIDGVVSSPPYAGSMEKQGGINPEKSEYIGGPHSQMNNSDTRYGETPGQLGAMPASDFDAAISSPPFGAAQTGGGINVNGYHNEEMRKGIFDLVGQRSYTPENQGTTPGNLASLPYDAAVSSPPFEKVQGFQDKEFSDRWGPKQSRTVEPAGYGSTPGNMGNSTGDTFWSAARAIVDQVYSILKPGGVAIWVCKRFVKDKAIVEFSQQWARMCEAAGFQVVHWHRAWLVEEKGTQYDLFGNGHHKTTARKSFFRRLAEKRGSPAIDWEDVICMRKP